MRNPWQITRGLLFAMKKLITIIITVAFTINNAGQGHALRPVANRDAKQKIDSAIFSRKADTVQAKAQSRSGSKIIC